MNTFALNPVTSFRYALSSAIPVIAASLLTSPAHSRTVLDIQPYLQAQTFSRMDGRTVKVINLNRGVGSWFLVRSGRGRWINIEDPEPSRIVATPSATGFLLSTPNGHKKCKLWGTAAQFKKLRWWASSRLTYRPICGGLLFVRNSGSDFAPLPDSAWQSISSTMSPEDLTVSPAPAQINHVYANEKLSASELGIDLRGGSKWGLRPGQWYPTLRQPDVFISLMSPHLVSRRLLQTYRDRVNPLTPGDADATVYTIAFDLNHVSVGWKTGRKLPGSGWSKYAAWSFRRPGLQGPDGFGNLHPLVKTAVVNPYFLNRLVGVFAGGFRRRDEAFSEKWGNPLAFVNNGSHYGHLENGVVLSSMQPGEATLITYKNGDTTIKVWTKDDTANIDNILYARQNGVPLINGIDSNGISRPGRFVNRWGGGNWSGNWKGQLLTPRTDACLQESNGHKYLLFSYFSMATPSSMARVLQSYHCKSAIHLDMNLPVFTYTALISQTGKASNPIMAEPLFRPMGPHTFNPRFVKVPDSRDFFFVYEK